MDTIQVLTIHQQSKKHKEHELRKNQYKELFFLFKFQSQIFLTNRKKFKYENQKFNKKIKRKKKEEIKLQAENVTKIEEKAMETEEESEEEKKETKE